MKSALTSAQHNLTRGLYFTESDLNANARGTVTEAQRKHLLRAVLRQFMLAIAAILASWAFVFVFTLIRAGQGMLLDTTRASQYAAWAVVAFAAFASLQLYLLRRALSNPVQSVEGIVELHRAKIGRPHYTIRIGDVTLSVSEEVYDAFEDSIPYRIYYLEPSIILSAEWLRHE